MVSAHEWPGRTLALDAVDQLPRRREFQVAHPGTLFEIIGNVYMGTVPYVERGTERIILMRGKSYRDVLDALEEYFAGNAPDTG